jgi:hypothetical protein
MMASDSFVQLGMGLSLNVKRKCTHCTKDCHPRGARGRAVVVNSVALS